MQRYVWRRLYLAMICGLIAFAAVAIDKIDGPVMFSPTVHEGANYDPNIDCYIDTTTQELSPACSIPPLLRRH